jgi:hypothetical protein
VPIVSSDIKYRLSGGASNSDPNASLGGAKSSVAVTNNSLHNLFDVVGPSESTAGDTEYRCFYVHNGHATLTLQNAKVWIQTNTPAAGTNVQIGLGSAAVNGTEPSVADESTAPGSVTFSTPASEGAALAIGDLAPGAHKAIWVKRIVSAGATSFSADSVVLRVKGDTLP